MLCGISPSPSRVPVSATGCSPWPLRLGLWLGVFDGSVKNVDHLCQYGSTVFLPQFTWQLHGTAYYTAGVWKFSSKTSETVQLMSEEVCLRC